MRKGWRIVLVIVAVCFAFGVVSAGVGMLTGADTARVSAVLEQRIAERHNIDADALIHEWVPQVIAQFQQQLSPAK